MQDKTIILHVTRATAKPQGLTLALEDFAGAIALPNGKSLPVPQEPFKLHPMNGMSWHSMAGDGVCQDSLKQVQDFLEYLGLMRTMPMMGLTVYWSALDLFKRLKYLAPKAFAAQDARFLKQHLTLLSKEELIPDMRNARDVYVPFFHPQLLEALTGKKP